MSVKRSYTAQDFSGALLLIAALFAFGLFNFKSDEPLVEAGLQAQADAVAQDSRHDVSLEVSGRDITLTGLADSDAEHQTILEQVRAFEGRGKIHDQLEVLDTIIPFETNARKTAGGTMLDGAVPSEAARAALQRLVGPAAENLTLAAGAPDGNWPVAMLTALRALAVLETGQMRLRDRDLALTGTALTPTARDRAMLILSDLPDAYAKDIDLGVLDDGRPLRLTAQRVDGNWTEVTGKLPATLDLPDGVLPDGRYEISALPAPSDNWSEGLRQGLTALAALQEGQLVLIGLNLALTGDALSETAMARAQAALAGIPGDFTISETLILADNGAPFTLRLTKSADGLQATGKVPRSLAPPVLEALAGQSLNTSHLQVASVFPGEDWWEASSLAARAVPLITSGEITFDGAAVQLDVRVDDPAAEALLTAHLALLPQRFEQRVSISLIDDGTPFRLVLRRDGQAMQATGKWPHRAGTPDLLARLTGALGQAVTEGPDQAQRLAKDAPEFWEQAALIGALALAELRSGSLELSGSEMRLTGTALNPAAQQAMMAQLESLPAGYTVTPEISFLDDGRPFAFVVDLSEGQALLSGKVPSDLGPASQSAIMGLPVRTGQLDRAATDADPEWWRAARTSLKALALLEQGHLQMDAYTITLSGLPGDEARRTRIRQLLSQVDGEFQVILTLD